VWTVPESWAKVLPQRSVAAIAKQIRGECGVGVMGGLGGRRVMGGMKEGSPDRRRATSD